MTAEHRLLIELKDITGFEFECPRCRARFFVPVEKYEEMKHLCANCREPWASGIGAEDYMLIHEALERLKHLKRAQPQPKVKIRFQIDTAEPGPVTVKPL